MGAPFVQAPVAEVHQPVRAEAHHVDEVHRQHPVERARDELRRDAGHVAQRDEGDELPAGARRRAGLVVLVRVHGPRKAETHEHCRFQNLCHPNAFFFRPILRLSRLLLPRAAARKAPARRGARAPPVPQRGATRARRKPRGARAPPVPQAAATARARPQAAAQPRAQTAPACRARYAPKMRAATCFLRERIPGIHVPPSPVQLMPNTRFTTRRLPSQKNWLPSARMSVTMNSTNS